ncbi:MAG: transglycosylase SLT domain-containing protein [Xanthobacteraceae bacterium]
MDAQGWAFGISRAATGAIMLAAALSVAQAQTATPSSSDKSSTAAKSTTPAAKSSTDKKSAGKASAKASDKSNAKHSAKHDDKKKSKSAKADDKHKSGEKKSAKAKTEKSKSAAKKTEPAAAPIKVALNAVPMPRTRPGATPDLRAGRQIASISPAPTEIAPITSAAVAPAMPSRDTALPNRPTTGRTPLVEGPATPLSDANIDAVRQAIATLRSGEPVDAWRLADSMSDPVARKLAQWVIFRSDNNTVPFGRYVAFVSANPTWPSISMFRKRAEAMAFIERPDDGSVRAYFAANPPLTGKGRVALARVMLAQGDPDRAQALVRQAWREDSFSADVESQIREEFGPLLHPGDDKARMERRLYANDTDAGLRAAKRLGGIQLAIARLRIAITEKSSKAKALAEAVPHDARHDIGYMFAQLQLLRRQDKIAEAGQLMLTVPRDLSHQHDTDEWWIERRLLARKLLDVGDAKTAYLVARDAAAPAKEIYKVESQFTAGWIALRFLHDPKLAAPHFARILDVTENPISVSRANYWLGRTAEAANRSQEARRYYEAAAKWTTAYYGQIARARLGLSDMAIAAPAASAMQRASVERLELVRAAEILYALDERNLALPFMADLGDKLDDVGALVALGEVTSRNHDARAMMQLGKAALARGHALGQYAFPAVGIPDYTPVGPAVEPELVYSIVRTESAFDQRDMSGAQAMGLMQVTPAAGKDTCKRVGCVFDRKRLMSDAVYNVQLGSAELAGVIGDYRGSYIMAFAAYNAGRGRVREWVERFGDPRDPNVDPIDWVERIPFAETRNYVQRVMENLQVYRVRFGGDSRLLIEADLKRGGTSN